MIKKLIEKRAAYKKQLDDLLCKAKTEERAMTPEETAEFDRIEGEIKNIDKTIDAEKRAMSLDELHSGCDRKPCRRAESHNGQQRRDHSSEYRKQDHRQDQRHLPYSFRCRDVSCQGHT